MQNCPSKETFCIYVDVSGSKRESDVITLPQQRQRVGNSRTAWCRITPCWAEGGDEILTNVILGVKAGRAIPVAPQPSLERRLAETRFNYKFLSCRTKWAHVSAAFLWDLIGDLKCD